MNEQNVDKLTALVFLISLIIVLIVMGFLHA